MPEINLDRTLWQSMLRLYCFDLPHLNAQLQKALDTVSAKQHNTCYQFTFGNQEIKVLCDNLQRLEGGIEKMKDFLNDLRATSNETSFADKNNRAVFIQVRESFNNFLALLKDPIDLNSQFNYWIPDNLTTMFEM